MSPAGPRKGIDLYGYPIFPDPLKRDTVSASGKVNQDMNVSVTESADLDETRTRAIASLSQRLHVPLQEARKAYVKEVERLESQARIRSFVEVLAVSGARAELRSRKALEPRS